MQHKAQWFGSEHLIVDLIVALLKTTVDDSAEYRSLPVVGDSTWLPRILCQTVCAQIC